MTSFAQRRQLVVVDTEEEEEEEEDLEAAEEEVEVQFDATLEDTALHPTLELVPCLCCFYRLLELIYSFCVFCLPHVCMCRNKPPFCMCPLTSSS